MWRVCKNFKLLKQSSYQSVNEAVFPARALFFFFFSWLSIEQICSITDWRLSSDGLEQKACVLEDFKTKADSFFVAHNDRLALQNRHCQSVHMHADKHITTVFWGPSQYVCTETLHTHTHTKMLLSDAFSVDTEHNLRATVITEYLSAKK